jgi:hypothetical protein
LDRFEDSGILDADIRVYDASQESTGAGLHQTFPSNVTPSNPNLIEILLAQFLPSVLNLSLKT